jgi:plastocyanin
VTIAVVVALVVGLSACGSSSKKVRPEQPPVDGRGKKNFAVDAQDDHFTPPNIVIDAGTTVTWTNKDSVAHNVQQSVGFVDFGAPFGIDTAQFGPGQTYSFKFTHSGVFLYTCTIHTAMTGRIQVGDGTGTPLKLPTTTTSTTTVP